MDNNASKSVFRKAIWWVFVGLCIIVGLYPLVYFNIDREFGLLASKSQELLIDQLWNITFYGHIVLGGIALLIGWSQFSSKLRKTRIKLHRIIGKVYLLSVLISGICSIYIAQFATGGINNALGFSMMGIVWLATSFLAYNAIKKGKIQAHQKYMIYSYAVCFSAVTLRIWLPILISITGDFVPAYQIVAWLSWLPNLLVAYLIVRRIELRNTSNI
jgi:uncharacterized membrane protein